MKKSNILNKNHFEPIAILTKKFSKSQLNSNLKRNKLQS